MRHILAHQYFGLNLDVVWDTVERDLPLLKRDVEVVARDLESRSKS